MDLSKKGDPPDTILIASISPYFLEKGNLWFEENLQQILEAMASQPFFQENILLLRKGEMPAGGGLSPLLRRLDEFGYEKVFEVEQPGEFTFRGGILDVFPVNTNSAFRIEFTGNTIESIQQLEATIEDETKTKQVLKKRLQSQKFFSDLKGIKEGDYLVHLDHGVAKFIGFSEIQDEEFYVLQYAANDTLYIPKGLERKLSRYVGFTEPRISRLGSVVWQKTKKRIREETEKLARELLELYANRELLSRKPYAIHTELEKKIASSFPYEETPDQLQALQEIKQDLQRDKPMDRLVCGDVGFGKTEIALRTMILAVENGYQAALLAPTTILAYQHFQNFAERLKNTPIQVALLSRLQNAKQEKEVLEKLQNKQIDIIVGTHRLLSQDVQFSPPPSGLGLLVIDDEQRFGVKQKERLRNMRSSLDILSLSATPIPRTLYMALSSLKGVSIVQTPPKGRLPVKTIVEKRNDKTVKEAIEAELKRGGQIYYLHNRVGTIQLAKKYLEKLAPKSKIAIAHAQLSETELLHIMEEFKNKKYDVLIATTIIENGIDLQNVNTLIVEDAPNLGLSQAYQLRGRVGRSHTQSFAYFLYDSKKLPEKARLRLEALEEAQDLGAGYRIAMRDMEIRGAGNILGREQAGSVNTIGLNLYCQMLSEAVEKMKGGSV